MRSLGVFAAFLLLISLIGWSVYEWIAVNDGIGYFAEDHRRIVLLAGVVGLATTVLVAYDAFPVIWKRNVTLWGMCCLAAGTTVIALCALVVMGRLLKTVYLAGGLSEFLCRAQSIVMLVSGGLVPAVMAICFWWAFFQMRDGNSA
jgi:hypothetical protein